MGDHARADELLAKARSIAPPLQDSEADQWLARWLEQYEQAISIARVIGNKRALAHLLSLAGDQAWLRGEYDDVMAKSEEAVRLSTEIGDQRMLANLLCWAGVFAREMGQLKQAREYFGQTLQLGRQTGDQLLVSRATYDLGELAIEEGQLRHAIELFEESADGLRAAGNDTMIVLGSAAIGYAHGLLGEHDIALVRLEAATEALRAKPFWRHYLGAPLVRLALTALDAEQY